MKKEDTLAYVLKLYTNKNNKQCFFIIIKRKMYNLGLAPHDILKLKLPKHNATKKV